MRYFLLPLTARNFARIDLEAKKIAEICKITRACVNRILREIRILIAKECEKISKMNGEIEVDESYFLLRFVLQLRSRRCKAWTQKKGGVKLTRKHLCFYFVLLVL